MNTPSRSVGKQNEEKRNEKGERCSSLFNSCSASNPIRLARRLGSNLGSEKEKTRRKNRVSQEHRQIERSGEGKCCFLIQLQSNLSGGYRLRLNEERNFSRVQFLDLYLSLSRYSFFFFTGFFFCFSLIVVFLRSINALLLRSWRRKDHNFLIDCSVSTSLFLPRESQSARFQREKKKRWRSLWIPFFDDTWDFCLTS